MDQERRPKTARPGSTRPEFRERAMRLVTETIEAEGRSQGVVTRIARQLDVNLGPCTAGSAGPGRTCATARAWRRTSSSG